MTDSRPNKERPDRDGAASSKRPVEPERRPYQRPTLKSGDRLETTTLASCRTGPAYCGPAAFEA